MGVPTPEVVESSVVGARHPSETTGVECVVETEVCTDLQRAAILKMFGAKKELAQNKVANNGETAEANDTTSTQDDAVAKTGNDLRSIFGQPTNPH